MERRDYVPPPADQRDTGAVFGSAGGHQPPARTPRAAVPTPRPAANWGDPQTGPCARCRQPTRRYGAGASPICADCRAARSA
jgi:hypothetical protein